ncbi:hypothetical protein CHS0354_033670 [Potamilus streckersoni]|uniref:Uncharacterized protein n=1 Tax=Potamilus streckersoni TaxID=2493646 RepID=A0AAE0S2G5_9BIVA|nr:hypothetical protein CHS0354_033670 [Potamilus streckersoni]
MCLNCSTSIKAIGAAPEEGWVGELGQSNMQSVDKAGFLFTTCIPDWDSGITKNLQNEHENIEFSIFAYKM